MRITWMLVSAVTLTGILLVAFGVWNLDKQDLTALVLALMAAAAGPMSSTPASVRTESRGCRQIGFDRLVFRQVELCGLLFDQVVDRGFYR